VHGLTYFQHTRTVEVTLLQQGKGLMDQAQAVFTRLVTAEQHLLVLRRTHSRLSLRHTLRLIAARTVLALLLAGLATGLLHRVWRARQRTQQEMAAHLHELEESRARFRQLLETIPNMAWTAQPDGTIDYYNQQWYDYTGLSFADLGGINWQLHIHPDDFARTEAAWQHSLQTGEPLTTLHNRWRRAADGEFRWHLVRAVALRDEATGAIRLWVGTNTDVHTQQQQQQQLEQVNADLDTFIYAASHDLKTPIHNLEALLLALHEELSVTPVLGDVAPLLAMMQGAADRLKGTIGHLTDVAKLQQLYELPAAEIDLVALVENVKADLRPLLAVTGGQLHLDVATCPTLAFAEKNLRSIVYNLLSNALKYRHPDRMPEVWLRTYPAAADGSRSAVLEVQDNGLGLTLGPEQERKLFALFERLHDHVEGTGMGLYIVKKIVENAGGRIEVESRLGQGTLFRLHLPLPRLAASGVGENALSVPLDFPLFASAN
jgi:PAS domain S-box-containing protein